MTGYKVWSVMQEQVYQTPTHDFCFLVLCFAAAFFWFNKNNESVNCDVNDPKQRLLDVWVALESEYYRLFHNFQFCR